MEVTTSNQALSVAPNVAVYDPSNNCEVLLLAIIFDIPYYFRSFRMHSTLFYQKFYSHDHHTSILTCSDGNEWDPQHQLSFTIQEVLNEPSNVSILTSIQLLTSKPVLFLSLLHSIIQGTSNIQIPKQNGTEAEADDDKSEIQEIADDLQVDLQVSSDFYWEFVTGETVRGDCGPVAIGTTLGWVLSGPTGEAEGEGSSVNLTRAHTLIGDVSVTNSVYVLIRN